jgi:hypothetical protein
MSEQVVFVVEVTVRTYDDLEQTVAAMRAALAASPIAEHVRMTANTQDAAARVLRALEPAREEEA